MAPQPDDPAAEAATAQQQQQQRLEPQRTRSSLTRRTTAERITEILDTGRGRAERASISSTQQQHPMHIPSNGAVHPTLDGRRPSARDRGDDEDSADERTGIVSRGDRVSYQSTATSDGGPRARNGVGRSEPAQQGQREEEHKRRREPWYKTLTEPFRSIELENKGSVARDHLAIERTFLAWLRTSLAFASIGIAVTQLFRLNTSLSENDPHHEPHTLRQLGKPLGATFLGISILMLFLGYRRFTESQRWVMEGKFPASRGVILLVSFLAFALTVASLVVVVVVHPREREL